MTATAAGRKEAIARLFRNHPREATEQRLNAMLEDTIQVPLDALSDVCAALSSSWTGKKAPLPGDVLAAWRTRRQELERQDDQRKALEAAALPDAADVGVHERDVLSYVAECREVWADGVYVPAERFVGRVLAVMFVRHRRGMGWPRPEPDDEQKEYLERALIDHERRHEGAQINWWSEWKEARGWL